MANVQQLNIRNLTGLKAESAKLVQEFFNREIHRTARQRSLFAGMLGVRVQKSRDGSAHRARRAIGEKYDAAKGLGDVINFPTAGELGLLGRHDDDILRGNEENPDQNNFQVTIGRVRHAVAWTTFMQAMASTGATLEYTYKDMMSGWLARKMDNDILLTMLRNATSANTIRPESKGSLDALLTTSTLDVETFRRAKSLLGTLGAEPLEVKTSASGSAIDCYCLVGGEQTLLPLKSDQEYRDAVEQGYTRGDQNPLFRGSYAMFDGSLIFGLKARSVQPSRFAPSSAPPSRPAPRQWILPAADKPRLPQITSPLLGSLAVAGKSTARRSHLMLQAPSMLPSST